MGEKAEKEIIIKTLTQENLRLASQSTELENDQKLNTIL